MPREDRRITFSYDEVYKAIFALCVQREVRKPPAGMIKAVDMIPGDSTRVNLRIENPLNDDPPTIMEFGLDYLAAALMLYCRTCRIPLPKTAEKSVELASDGVILRVQINQLTL
ncbi:MAG TPA: hypothetical protein VGD95_08095 [Micavibrio sp.]